MVVVVVTGGVGGWVGGGQREHISAALQPPLSPHPKKSLASKPLFALSGAVLSAFGAGAALQSIAAAKVRQRGAARACGAYLPATRRFALPSLCCTAD